MIAMQWVKVGLSGGGSHPGRVIGTPGFRSFKYNCELAFGKWEKCFAAKILGPVAVENQKRNGSIQFVPYFNALTIITS